MKKLISVVLVTLVLGGALMLCMGATVTQTSTNSLTMDRFAALIPEMKVQVKALIVDIAALTAQINAMTNRTVYGTNTFIIGTNVVNTPSTNSLIYTNTYVVAP